MPRRGMSSIVMIPERGSSSLSSSAIRLDLPLPVRPQMATFSPAFMERSIWLKASLGDAVDRVCVLYVHKCQQ
jgi:hypothetical protein